MNKKREVLKLSKYFDLHYAPGTTLKNANGEIIGKPLYSKVGPLKKPIVVMSAWALDREIGEAFGPVAYVFLN